MKYILALSRGCCICLSRDKLNNELNSPDDTLEEQPIVPEIIELYNNHEYVDLGLPSGVKWAVMNIGALNETDGGLYFQWGDTQGYTTSQVGVDKLFTMSTYKYGNGTSSPGDSGLSKYNSTDGKTTLDFEDDAARANMGGLWRMPTETEFRELLNTSNCTKSWKTNYNGSGINGYLFTSKSNSNTLFLPAAGNCSSGNVFDVNSGGHYWSSSLSTTNVEYGKRLIAGGMVSSVSDYGRAFGCSIRGVVNK